MDAAGLDSSLGLWLQTTPVLDRRGKVVEAVGTLVRASGLDVQIGQTCHISDPSGTMIPAEVVGFSGPHALLTPLRPLRGISRRSTVVPGPLHTGAPVGPGLLGRVIDCEGAPLDGRGPIDHTPELWSVDEDAPSPLDRWPVTTIFQTGIRAVDSLLTVGEGQRVGVFATAGGGKSTFLATIARNSAADVNVIALVGERGREVREFLYETLKPEALARSVVVVSTADRAPMERVRAALTATAVAEYFRSKGRRVLLMMDSVTRLARAMRDVGLSAGEPPIRRGFPPSVFAQLPRLFERAGALEQGSITAFYSVLLEDEDGDPIGEEVRSLLDGHIHLSREMSEAGHYPPIDIGRSASRLFPNLAVAAQRSAAAKARRLLSKHKEIELLVQVGEYQAGADPVGDEAIARMPALEGFLRQPNQEIARFADSVRLLAESVGS